MIPQRLARLARDLFGAFDDVGEAVVGVDPFGRGLGADAGDPRQVVAGLPHQRCQLRVALRRHEVFLLHRDGCHPHHVTHPLARVQHRGLVGHQLQGVAVARRDQHLVTRGLRPGGHCCDDVVGLVAGQFDVRYPQPVEDLLDQLHLPSELLRRRAPGGLVLRVGLVAEGLPAHVEGDGHVARFLGGQQPDEHGDETVHCVRVLSRRGLEVLGRQGVKSPVGHGVSVDEEQAIHTIKSTVRDWRP